MPINQLRLRSRTCRLIAMAPVLLAVLFAVPAAHGQPRYDLLLKGGHVIDPRHDVDGPMDVGIADGKIAAVEASIDPAEAGRVIDVNGLYVTPGLIDMHVHLFATTGMKDAWAGDNSVLPTGSAFARVSPRWWTWGAPAGATSKTSATA